MNETKLTSQDVAALVTLVRRAPLANLAEAEAAMALLNKLVAHFAPPDPKEPEAT